jgi:hypothetical protein
MSSENSENRELQQIATTLATISTTLTTISTQLTDIKTDTFDQLVKSQALIGIAVQQRDLLQKIVQMLNPPQLKTMRLIFAVAK